MSLIVTGSIGIDRIETPAGTAEEALGGSATYFSARWNCPSIGC